MTSFRHIKNKREIRRQSIKLSQVKPNPKNTLFRQAFIDIPMLTSIDLGKSTSLHTMESQGWSQDFPLGGANLEEPCLLPRVPLKLKTPRIWPTKNKMCGLGSLLRPGGPWSVTWGPDSLCGGLIRLAGPWHVLWGPDSFCGA